MRDLPDTDFGALDAIVQQAEHAFETYSCSPGVARAGFLEAIAAELETRGDGIVAAAFDETALPKARLIGELGRTTGQLRMFADLVRQRDYLEYFHDVGDPDRVPLPKPDLQRINRPIGPVAVFGASNFPLAFSVAGGDTASALAAGCPVVVKAHPAHPRTSDLTAEAIEAARQAQNMPKGVFAMVQGASSAIGAALVQHPLISAVGFTGSLAGGRALFDLCASRPTPIPFFGELGSINPTFVLPDALSNRGSEIAQGWAASMTLGAGQFCTSPGVTILLEGQAAEAFALAAKQALAETPAQVMLHDGIAKAYTAGATQARSWPGVETLLHAARDGREQGAVLLRTDLQTWMQTPELREEVFGPFGVIVVVPKPEDMLTVARGLDGQLTATCHTDEQDESLLNGLMGVLSRKAGRLLLNGFPTGVEVSPAMIHGGPYPASTNFGHTAVGAQAIKRWLRPVCYQNAPKLPLG